MAAKFVAFFSSLLAAVTLLSAHEPGLSTTVLEVDEGMIRLTVGISPADLPSLVPAADEASLVRMAPSLWSLAGDRGPLAARETTVTHDPENGAVLHLAYDPPSGPRLLLRFAAFDRLPSGHRDYFSWMNAAGTVEAAQLLDAEHPSITLTLPDGWSATSGRAEQTNRSQTHRHLIVGAAASLAGLLWLLRHRLAQRARRSRSTH